MNEQNNFESTQFNPTVTHSAQTTYKPFEKPKRIYNSTDRVFAVIALVLGFLFIKTVFQYGLLMAVVLLGITVFNYTYSLKSKLRITHASAAVFLCMALLSASFAISDNNTVKLVNLMIVIVSNLYLVYTSHKSKYNTVVLDAFKAVFISPFYEYSSVFGAVFHNEKKLKEEKDNLFPIVVGLCLSIPITVFAIILLASSDNTFASIIKWVGNLNFDLVFWNIMVFLVSLPVGMYIFGAVYSRAYKKRNEESLPKGKPIKFDILPTTMCNAFLTPLCLVYTVYIISQISHFFSNLFGVVGKSFDYCTYARQGFFQLCFVVVLNLGAISLVVFLVKHKDNLLPSSSKVYICVFSLLTIMLIATGLTKMIMYINFYGLTPLRVYTSVFMIWLFMLFVVLIIKQFVPRFSITKISYCFAVCIMIAMSFLPVDGLIAKYNLKWYEEGKIGWMGYDAIYELDASAVPYINDEVERDILRDKYSVSGFNIYNFNFTRYFAYCSLAEK